MGMIQSVVIDIPGSANKIFVESSDQELISSIALQYYPYISYERSVNGASLLISVTDNKIIYANSIVKIDCNNKKLYILKRIIQNSLIMKDGYLLLHASAVSYDDKAVVFLGKTGAGKSTLSLYLMGLGLDYLSDDSTIINLLTDQIVPYPRLIQIRDSAYNLLRQHNFSVPLYHSGTKSHPWIALPPVLKPINFSQIILVDIKAGCETELIAEVTNMNEKMRIVAENIFTVVDMHKSISTIFSLANKVSLIRYHYSGFSGINKFLDTIFK